MLLVFGVDLEVVDRVDHDYAAAVAVQLLVVLMMLRVFRECKQPHLHYQLQSDDNGMIIITSFATSKIYIKHSQHYAQIFFSFFFRTTILKN